MNSPVIQIENLSKRFGLAYALKGIDLRVEEGEIFGIIGMSGAGKSTLVRCLTSLESPNEGRILYNSQDITQLSKADLIKARKKMGMIFQHFNLFDARTALQNVSYPLEIDGVSTHEREERATTLLKRVGLFGKKEYFPSQLSGGEKQRVAIARALAREPDLLICDEATSALDPRTTQSILELLLKLNQDLKLTILLITHEMEVIKQICTSVAVLEAGEVIEQGKTVDLFATPQHPTTKHFLQNLPHAVPEHVFTKGENEILLRLTFTGKSAAEPVISQLIRRHNVEVNILLGGIDILRQETVGSLVIALSGDEEEKSKACSFLKDKGVNLEKIT